MKTKTISLLQNYLKEIVYGGNDGIVTTFAVVAGFTGASAQSNIAPFSYATVLLFGLANLAGDATSMGMGNFLSVRSEQAVYNTKRRKELEEIRKDPEKTKALTTELLLMQGYTKEQAEDLTKIYAKNEKYWTQFLMNHKLNLPNPTDEKAMHTGIATFIAFVFFGFIPLLPYIFFRTDPNLFAYSLLFSFSALILLGILRGKLVEENMLQSILEIVAVGSIASLLAYIVGTFFKL